MISGYSKEFDVQIKVLFKMLVNIPHGNFELFREEARKRGAGGGGWIFSETSAPGRISPRLLQIGVAHDLSVLV